MTNVGWVKRTMSNGVGLRSALLPAEGPRILETSRPTLRAQRAAYFLWIDIGDQFDVTQFAG